MNNFKNSAQEIYELIKKSNPIIIHRHINPDGDALGSQWGLKEIIEANFPNKSVLIPGDNAEHMMRFFQPGQVLTKNDYQDALVIVCDTANRERISGEFWQEAKTIIKFDHHPEVDDYGTVNLVDSSAAAACQIVAKWAKVLDLEVPQTAARHLFLGLVTDSGRFLYRSVSSETFEMANFLTTKNFNLLDLYEELYAQELKTAWIRGYVLSNFQISASGVGYLIFSKEDLLTLEKELNQKIKASNKAAKITLVREDLTNQVNLLANIKGIKIWFIACQDPIELDFKISVRSSRWKINDLVAEFGGGGHDVAAGARLANLNLVQQLFAGLDKLADLPPTIK